MKLRTRKIRKKLIEKQCMLVALLFLVLPFYSIGQQDQKISGSSELFIQEVGAILLQTSNRNQLNESRTVLRELEAAWNEGRFSGGEKTVILSVAEKMQQNNLRPYPHLAAYIGLANQFAKSRLPGSDIIIWNNHAISMLNNGETRRFNELVTSTSRFLANDQLADRSGMVWYARNATYSFEADSLFRIRFEKADLVCASRRDSSTIHQTAALFVMETQTWKGEGGKLFWWRFGFDPDKVYVDFQNYVIDLNNAEYVVDSVVFHNYKHLDTPILGRLHEKVFSSPPSNRTQYPRFSSYFRNHMVQNVFRGIDFEGGITMEGQNLIGTGDGSKLAAISIRHNNKLAAKIQSDAVVISAGRLFAERAIVSIYLDNDSLYHPGIRLQYNDNNRNLLLSRSDRGIADAPFFSFYHKANLYVEALYWNLDSPTANFWRLEGPGDQSQARFESVNYFFEPHFQRLQGIDIKHPMFVLFNYRQQYPYQENIPVPDLAFFMKVPEEQVVAQLLRLASHGYVIYNGITRTASLTERFFHTLDARAGKADFDRIEMKSTTTGRQPNAVLNIETAHLQLFGVDEVLLNQNGRVRVYPDRGELTLMQNLDFSFSGLIRAGLFNFFANESRFVYDSFLLNMTHIDSMVFFVPERGQSLSNPNLRFVKVRNRIADLNGTLQIDGPNNKSGRERLPLYPVFESRDESYVYFENDNIQAGKLDKERFYFVVDPFRIDSLDQLSMARWRFDGHLFSADIFPGFREPLVVMDDYSLGFNHTTPDAGYEMFRGKAQYFNNIHLSNNGFYGYGSINYLTSFAESEKFVFYPDSVNALLQTYEMLDLIDVVEFPHARGELIDMHWCIAENHMTLATKQRPMEIFGRASFTGTAEVSPRGMTANGLIAFDNAEISSDWLSFKNQSFIGDTADFRIKTGTAKDAFLAKRYLAAVDFGANQGAFNHIDQDSELSFPFNQYVCTLDEAIWYMDEAVVRLNNNRVRDNFGLESLDYNQLMDIDLSGSEFTSLHPEQESLSFFSLSAEYDMQAYAIRAKDVKIIRLADAALFPADGLITIYENARMEPVDNAVLIADTLTRLHQIYASKITIHSKNKFEGFGDYNYIDAEGNLQTITLSAVGVENGRTIATGEISEIDGFFLNPYFRFMGNVSLRSERKELEFSGGYKLISDCFTQDPPWVAFNALIDPFNIKLPVEEQSVDLSGMRLYTGLYNNRETNAIYSLLQNFKRSHTDEELYKSIGSIWFNPDNQAFEVIKTVQGQNKVIQSLSTRRCIGSGSGLFDLGLNLPYVDKLLLGDFEHRLIPDTTYLNVVLSLGFPFSNELMGVFADSLFVSNTTGLNLNRSNYLPALSQLLGEQETGRIRSDVSLYGAPRNVPEPVDKTLTLVDLKLRWNPETRSFVSQGPIGISNIGRNQVNKYVDGFVEVEKVRNRDGFSMYFTLGRGQWYFFTYNNGFMQAMSSSTHFNSTLLAIDQPNRSFTDKEKRISYEYVISTRRRVTDFIRKMQNIEF